MNETNKKANSNPTAKRRQKVFKGFAEYWHLVKFLTVDQRKVLVASLSKPEQRSLRTSYDKGGWQDLFMRNACDAQLEQIKLQFDIDLLELRMKVLSGSPQLMQKSFWKYTNACFDGFPWEHIAYIFDGVTIKDHDESYVKLIRYAGE